MTSLYPWLQKPVPIRKHISPIDTMHAMFCTSIAFCVIVNVDSFTRLPKPTYANHMIALVCWWFGKSASDLKEN
jgi:hypothetical protein